MPPMRSLIRVSAVAFGVLSAGAVAMTQAQTTPASDSSSPAKSAAHVRKANPTPTPAKLDLSAPPLSHIYPSRDLQYIMAYDPNSDDAAGEVSVKGTKQVVVVPGGPGNQFVAIPWALLHLTQAWRILTPIVQP